MTALRVVASPASVDRAVWPSGTAVLRIAEDEAVGIGADTIEIDDPHAITIQESGLCGFTLDRTALEEWLRRSAEWSLPAEDHLTVQGAVAGIPVKILLQGDRALVVTGASLGSYLEERS